MARLRSKIRFVNSIGKRFLELDFNLVIIARRPSLGTDQTKLGRCTLYHQISYQTDCLPGQEQARDRLHWQESGYIEQFTAIINHQMQFEAKKPAGRCLSTCG